MEHTTYIITLIDAEISNTFLFECLSKVFCVLLLSFCIVGIIFFWKYACYWSYIYTKYLLASMLFELIKDMYVYEVIILCEHTQLFWRDFIW